MIDETTDFRLSPLIPSEGSWPAGEAAPAIAGLGGAASSVMLSGDAVQGRAPGRIGVADDRQAVSAWLQEYRQSPQTWRAYRREAERLLLWVGQEGMSLAQVSRDDLRRFEAFLADPRPAGRWVGSSRPRHHPQWRPFRGPLSPASRRQSLVILQGLFSWLVEAGWLAYNPFRLMRDRARRLDNRSPGVERYLEKALWDWLWEWLNRAGPLSSDPAAIMAGQRRRILFAFAYLLAPRLSEMAQARMKDIRRREGRWWWDVVGKGNKAACVPVPEDFMGYLGRWRESLGLLPYPEVNEDTPLLRDLSGRRGLGDNQLYRLIREVFGDAAGALEAEGGSYAHCAALRQATPHWLRHTAITHQAQAGVDLQHLARSARHARLETTSRYLHTERHLWHADQQRHRLLSVPVDGDPSRDQ